MKIKKAQTIVEALNIEWNCNFGIPSEGYWADNGGEFKNREVLEFCEKTGITIKPMEGSEGIYTKS